MNITFDLETLGRINAPIAQIAAVAFKDNGSIVGDFNMRVDLNDLKNYNFQVDYNTVEWWMKQSDSAIKSVFVEDMKHDLKTVLEYLSSFFSKYNDGNMSVWSHATFDPPILAHAYNEVGIENPIHFRWHKDIRTLTGLSGVKKTVVQGVEHNAIDDCINQANYISKAIQELNKNK